MSWSSDQDDSAIVRLEGRPVQSGPEEPQRWRWFRRVWRAVWSDGGDFAKYGVGLGQAYVEAEVSRKQNESAKLAAEAADLAADAELKKQKKVTAVNDEIARIVASDLPDGAKALQLASLLQANPELQQQIAQCKELLEHLYITRGTRVGILPGVESGAPTESTAGESS